jgi:hypothetical protein
MGKYKKEMSGINTDEILAKQAFEYIFNRYLDVSEKFIPLRQEHSELSSMVFDYFREYPGVFERILKERDLQEKAKEIIRALRE